jgi:hypothetical protein
VIHPSATDILRTIDATIVSKIEPSLSDLAARSALATVRHLLRHVMVRIEAEGQILTDDIAAEARDYFSSLGTADEGIAHASRVESAQREVRRDASKYPSLAILSTEAAILRECLYESLKHLQAIRDRHRSDPAYISVRTAIRAYLAKQIEQEGQLIAPAFYGMGPRR